MKPVKQSDEKKFHGESVRGVDAVLDRMWEGLGKPPGSFAMAFDVPEGTVKTWRKRGEVSPRFMVDFAARHDLSLDWLMTGETIQDETIAQSGVAREPDAVYRRSLLEDFVTVPRYDVQGSCGAGAVIHSEQIVDYLAFRADWVHTALGVSEQALALISVKGDSMEPTLSNGDLILLDTSRGAVEDNAVYALQHNGTLLVKRVQRRMDGTVVVKSDNARYEPETLTADQAGALKVVGRVVWSGRRM